MSSRKGTIEIIARGLVKDRAGRVLLCKNIKGGYYYLPGGHVELGEQAAIALKREFAEETGRRAIVGRLLACEEHLFHRKGRIKHEINLVFHVELNGSTSSVRSVESNLLFEWLPMSSLAAIDLRPASAMKICRLNHRARTVRWISTD